MADDKRDALDPAANAAGRPTIDLKATEIASEPVKPTEPVETAAETPRAGPPPGGAAAPPDPPPAPGANSVAAGMARCCGDERTPLRPARPVRLAASPRPAPPVRPSCSCCSSWSGRPARSARATMPRRRSPRGSRAWKSRCAISPPGRSRRRPIRARSRISAARVAAAEQAMGRLADLDSRLGKAEQGLAKAEQGLAKAEQAAAAPRGAQTDQALTARVAALEAAMRPLAEIGSRLDAASAAARDAKARADAAFEAAQKNAAVPAAQAADHKEIEALAARVAALEQALKSSEARVAATAGADKAGRLAFVAVALRAAVERGEPFAQELAAVRPLVPTRKRSAPLEPFAASGVPRAAALARELSALTGADACRRGRRAARDGFIDRLQANAERLVRIRPINEAPGDDPATVIGRADVKAAHGDLAGARRRTRQPAGRGARAGARLDRPRAGARGRARRRAQACRRRGRRARESRTVSMIRVVAFLVAVTLLALGVVWLADRPGTVTITWLGQRADLSVMVAIIGIGLVAVAAVLLWSLRAAAVPHAEGDLARDARPRSGAGALPPSRAGWSRSARAMRAPRCNSPHRPTAAWATSRWRCCCARRPRSSTATAPAPMRRSARWRSAPTRGCSACAGCSSRRSGTTIPWRRGSPPSRPPRMRPRCRGRARRCSNSAARRATGKARSSVLETPAPQRRAQPRRRAAPPRRAAHRARDHHRGRAARPRALARDRGDAARARSGAGRRARRTAARGSRRAAQGREDHRDRVEGEPASRSRRRLRACAPLGFGARPARAHAGARAHDAGPVPRARSRSRAPRSMRASSPPRAPRSSRWRTSRRSASRC